MDTTQRIKAATAALMVGFLLAIAFAATAQAGNNTAQGVRTRADATNRYYRLGAYNPGVAAAKVADQLRGQAINAFYHLGAVGPSATAVQKAEELRGEAMNRFYGIGSTGPSPAVKRAEELRGQAMNRFYGIGSYAVAGSSSPFGWGDAGTVAGGVLGVILLAAGLTVLLRNRPAGQPSSPSTT